MDLLFLGNAMLFLGAFAWQFGLIDLDMGAGTDDAADTGEAPNDDPLYDPANYAGETAGTDGNDSVDGASNPLDHAYFLLEGNDELNATFGDDYANGGTGDDVLEMRPGNDIALGGAGDDTIDGGLGDDTLFGGDGNDAITGNKDDDLIFGEAGADLLEGSGGADTLDGGAGNDTLYGNLSGDAGNTADGPDSLDGGDDDDELHLGAGDSGTGGAGADTFNLYDIGDTGNLIQVNDFDPGEDVISVYYTPMTDPVSGDPISPSLTVTDNDDGTASTLSLNGIDIATIAGGQGLNPDEIVLIADPAI